MRQYQLFDMSVRSNHPDNRRWHMEASFHSGSALRYGVMSDEQICVQRELRQSVSFAVRISTKDDPLAPQFHSPRQCGKPTMNHAHCVHDDVGVAKHEYRFGTGYHIMWF